MNYKLRIKNKNKGLSLVETLIAIGIFILASGAIYLFINQGFKVQNFSLNQTIAISEARRGVETMVREIRETQTADHGAYPVVEAQVQQYIFYSDIDKDNAVEKVRYFLDGSEFKKGIIEPRINPIKYDNADEIVSTLSRYVRNNTDPVFTYYNGDWPGDALNNPLSTPADVTEVKLINVKLRINVRPNQAPNDFILESDVSIRNLKDNL